MTLKTAIQGLLDRQGRPKLSIIKAYVVDCDWAELQPVAGGPLASGTKLDQALQSGYRIKLRASRAGGAPVNAKKLGGGPWTITNPASGQSATIGPYWSPAYLAFYADYQNKMAAKYDGALELAQNVMAEPASVFDEPFIEPGVSGLPGWTLTADEAAFVSMLHAHKVWPTTLQEIAFNPFIPGPTSFTDQVMRAARTLFGKQVVLGNNSLRDGDLGAAYDAMYALIKGLGPPIYFQTAQLIKGVGASTFAKALAYGANSIELPAGYQSGISLALLEQTQAKLIANPT